MELTRNARKVLERRYLLANETPEDMLKRVAQAIAEPEGRKRATWSKRFFELMDERRFLPNTPTLLNAGRGREKKGGAQLAACFVLPIEDSLESIFDALKNAALIHQSGGGTGFAFSNLRPKGSFVRKSRQFASGPVSFLRIFDMATETIKQGGARRGANMGVLRVDHPDIEEFIELKRNPKELTNFNISVGITREFMKAVDGGGDIALRSPVSGNHVKKVKAKDLWRKICEAAWECGDPGLVFLDRANFFNPTPKEGAFESTNPCGEQPLLGFESCNLGSLNLNEYFEEGGFNWALFGRDIATCVRFLDNVIEVNEYPLEECERITKRNRKIGLGLMGFADVLLRMGIPYDSQRGREFGERVMSFLDRRAKEASRGLACERGVFRNWTESSWKRLGYPPLRNATVTTVAPTGTISILAGASSGIEPIFSAVYMRNILEGERLEERHPAVEQALLERGIDTEDLGDERLFEVFGASWAPARHVGVHGHVGMQAAFQRFSDSAVSKTVNLPNGARVEDVEGAYLLAYRLGCKGITVFRDGCRPTQVLEGDAGVCSSC